MRLGNADVGLDRPFFLIAGPCVVESQLMAVDTAGFLKELTDRLNIPFVYKSSYDKANRSSSDSYRGPGLEQGLRILQTVREETGVSVLTDVHSPDEVAAATQVVDVLQTPALLCRQTDLIEAAAASGKPVNIKKGQFLSPHEMRNVVDKAIRAGGKDRTMVCERGTCFGYNNLVVDMRALAVMRATGCPVVFDTTHSVQLPGGLGTASGGEREHIAVLARAAVGAGVSGVFLETHPDPARARSDGPNAMPLNLLEPLLVTLQKIDHAVKRQSFLEDDLR